MTKENIREMYDYEFMECIEGMAETRTQQKLSYFCDRCEEIVRLAILTDAQPYDLMHLASYVTDYYLRRFDEIESIYDNEGYIRLERNA